VLRPVGTPGVTLQKGGYMVSAEASPVKVQASFDQRLSRWLWLKWLSAIPHYIALAFLWIAFVLLSVAAFFAIANTPGAGLSMAWRGCRATRPASLPDTA